jgi:hypothetical protein
MARSVVCISHATGAGGEEIGHLVADRLGFLYVDEEVIDRAARRAGIDPEQVADEERRKPLFAGLLDYLTEGDSQVLLSPPATAELRSEAVRAFIRASTSLERIRSLRERGVIRGYHAEADLAALGREVQALIAIRIRPPSRENIEAFRERPEVADVNTSVVYEHLRNFAIQPLGRTRGPTPP